MTDTAAGETEAVEVATTSTETGTSQEKAVSFGDTETVAGAAESGKTTTVPLGGNGLDEAAGFANMSKEMLRQHRRREKYHARANTERYLLLTDDVIDASINDQELGPTDNWKCWSLILIVLVLGSGGIAGAALGKWWSGIVYSSGFLVIGTLLVYLDHIGQFHKMQTLFEDYQKKLLISFCVIAFIDYMLIALNEDRIIKGLTAFVVIEVLYWTAMLLFICLLLAYWKVISFHCHEQSWTHALFYLSVIGGAILTIARWLRPPELYSTAHWHRRHELRKVLSSVTKILVFMFLFCVILGGILITAFAEFSRWSSDRFGVGVALGAFIVLSMIIMLTPLAPGSIVDACGGFVFVYVLEREGWDVFGAWALAMVSVSLLHYCGACAQWYIGTLRCVQIWGNQNLPVEMLAASDAVLREANWFEVGLIGYLFMDTANGLNQGRVNMEFWTQLWSEWPAWVNAIGLVSLGSVIAASTVECDADDDDCEEGEYDWTEQMVPLLILTATLIQSVGVTFGTHAMGSSVDGVKYWTAREKWTMMHLCYARGYVPTEEGWANDVFNLGSAEKKLVPSFTSVLYDLIAPIHKKYIEDRNATNIQAERIKIWTRYSGELMDAKDKHFFDNFEELAEAGVKKGWLVYEEPEQPKLGFFDVENMDDEEEMEVELPEWKRQLWIVLVFTMIITFWVSFYFIYWSTDLTTSVADGLKVLNRVPIAGWICAGIFIGCTGFIYHIEMWEALQSTWSVLQFAVCGCQINPEVETKFQTPEWTLPPEMEPVIQTKKLNSVKSGSEQTIANDELR